MDDSGYQYASRSITPVPPANAHNPRSVNFSNHKLNLLFFFQFYSLCLYILFYYLYSLYLQSFYPFWLSVFFQNYDNIGSIRSRKHAPPPPVSFNQPQPPLIRSTDNYSSNIQSKSNIDSATHNWEYNENKTNKSSGNPNRFDHAISKTNNLRYLRQSLILLKLNLRFFFFIFVLSIFLFQYQSDSRIANDRS